MKINHIEIKVPYWKARGWGIAEQKMIGYDYIAVTCPYKNKDGSLTFPGVHYMATEKARTFKTEMCKGLVLHLIPASAFDKEIRTPQKSGAFRGENQRTEQEWPEDLF